MLLWILVIAFVFIHWLWRVNNDYYILAFFARRVQTSDGSPVERIAPTPKGNTIFAHTFDVIALDNVGVFEYSRKIAQDIGKSYIQYAMGVTSYNVIDAETAEIILNDPNLITKGFIYNFLHPVLRTGVLTSSEEKWHIRRKMLTPTFHFNILPQFEEVFKAESIKLICDIKAKRENVISLSTLIPKFTLNSICETSMGVKLDDMAEKGDSYRRSFNMIDQCFIRRICNPLFWFESIFNLFAAHKYKPHLKVVHDFSSEIIAKRRKLFEEVLQQRRETQTADDDIYTVKKERFAMLDTLICAEKDGLIDHIGICEEVDTLMFEGFDTISMGLIFAIMNLSLYAEEQEKCYQEIQEHIDDDLTKLDIGQLNKLKYLECFIKETLRLYPSVPVIGRMVVQETKLRNNLILPANTEIAVHIFDIHRNPKHYKNPNEFDPKRFFPENSIDRHTYAFLPFSAGQRNCLGQKYAMFEMKTLIVAVLKNFKVLPLVDQQEFAFEAGIVIRSKDDIKVELLRRD